MLTNSTFSVMKRTIVLLSVNESVCMCVLVCAFGIVYVRILYNITSLKYQIEAKNSLLAPLAMSRPSRIVFGQRLQKAFHLPVFKRSFNAWQSVRQKADTLYGTLFKEGKFICIMLPFLNYIFVFSLYYIQFHRPEA